MSKGQQKSNREGKKPKKTPAEKAKASGSGSAYKQSLTAPAMTPNFGGKKK